jgi:hypothetical protein
MNRRCFTYIEWKHGTNNQKYDSKANNNQEPAG